MLKCSSERWVCAPQSLSAGTSTTPRLSVSRRMLLIMISPYLWSKFHFVLNRRNCRARRLSAHLRTALENQHLPKLRQIEAERGVCHDIATSGRSTCTAPQVATYVHELVPLFDPAVLAPVEAIPVAHCRFIDVAI